MMISGNVALVTGGQRGIGQAIAAELVARGASKVYVTAREPAATTDPRIVPLALDTRDDTAVAQLADAAFDASIVVNNAGIDLFANLQSGEIDAMRDDFDVKVFGLVDVTRVMAPVLAKNGGGRFLNILTPRSWKKVEDSYTASKAATWPVTNGFRALRAAAGTGVTAVHLGYTDMEMIAHLDVPTKVKPHEAATHALDAFEAGDSEVLVDDTTLYARTRLAGDPSGL